MKFTIVFPEDARPVCDRPGCGKPWPGPKGRELPGASRMAGIDERGRMAVKLYCGQSCAEADWPIADGQGR